MIRVTWTAGCLVAGTTKRRTSREKGSGRDVLWVDKGGETNDRDGVRSPRIGIKTRGRNVWGNNIKEQYTDSEGICQVVSLNSRF